MQSTPLIIISALLGALLSAALSFAVRLVLDRRAQRDTERRLAYVYLVRVSELVAVDIVVRSVLKLYVSTDAQKSLTSTDGSYEPSHKICVMLADMLSKQTPEVLGKSPSTAALPHYLKSMLEVTAESRLPPDQLAKLPKEAVFACHQFQNHHRFVGTVVEMWIAFFEDGDSSWVNAEGIHDQWRAIARFTEQAHKVRTALVRYGAATPDQATKLLSAQVSEIHESVVAKFVDKPKLLAAVAAAQQEVQSVPAA
jgi:hypothetical protein